MKLSARLKRLESYSPGCQRIRKIPPDHVPGESDRCPRCGKWHMLVIKKVVVETHPRPE